MSRALIPPDTPCVVPGFDPASDMLVIALPEDARGGLDHSLGFRHDGARGFLEVVLTHLSSGARFVIHLPGVAQIDTSSIAVVSLADAAALLPAARARDSATLTGEGVYPADAQPSSGGTRKMAFVHRHNWRRNCPPPERYFDLSDPASELDIRLEPNTGGPIYAIRLTENSARLKNRDPGIPPADDNSEVYRSIVIAQTAPGTPQLAPDILAQWFATRLDTNDFRVLAWIFLGSEGSYTDPKTGQVRRFGRINRSPQLAIHGPLAGSVAVDR